MEQTQFSRTEMLTGKEATEILKNSKVILFGLGGVGSYTAEALARAGIGEITLVDSDCITASNINRQLCALHSTVGLPKTDVVKARIKEINPLCKINTVQKFYLPENSEEFSLSEYDYIADAIDTVSAKIDLAVKAQEYNIPIISCMGTGNKFDPTLFKISDIFKTSGCPLCRVMRRELKNRQVKKLNVVWSPEEPAKPAENSGENSKRQTPGSLPFVPGVAGLILAGKIIKDLINKE